MSLLTGMVWVNAGTVHWMQAVVSVSPDWHGVGERGHCALGAGCGECLLTGMVWVNVHWVQAVVSVSPGWHGVGERGHCALGAGCGECLS